MKLLLTKFTDEILILFERGVQENRLEWEKIHNKINFQHDNAKPHTDIVIKIYLEEQH